MSLPDRGAAEGELAAPGASTPTITTRPEDSVPRRMRNMLALADFEKAAKRHLPPSIFGYISGAAEERSCLHQSRAAFEELSFVPRFRYRPNGK